MAAASWLQRQRKTDLIDIAHDAGYSNPESMLKEDLATALDDHLRKNASRLASKPSLAKYYDRSGSPTKKDPKADPSPTSDGEPKPKSSKGRRVTKVKDELDSTDEKSPEKSLATRTPRAVQRVASRVPLPPSPAVLSDAIDRQSKLVSARVSDYATKTGIKEAAESFRDVLSSVVGIEFVTVLVEAWGLQRETLPWRYAFLWPANKIVGTPSYPVSLPDLFYLLTGSFWSASALWVSTSLTIPIVTAYFFNLTLTTKTRHGATSRRPSYSVDPLTFNITKALLAYLVYGQGFRLGGLASDGTVARVNAALPGGYHGVIIGAFIGILTSIYEAVLRK